MTTRTEVQNKALHKYLELVAKELENQGQTMRDVLWRGRYLEVPPTKHSIKEMVWKPIQNATLGKKSTTELTTKEINQVYEVMSMFLARNFGIDIPFPSQNEL